MRAFLSGIDLACIVKELLLITGSKINKIQHINDELLLSLYHPQLGNPVLRIIRGRMIHLTTFKKESPLSPSNFCAYLRKYLTGATLTSVVQPGLERIVELEFQRDKAYKLIVELFSKGNIVLTDINYKILNCLENQTYSSRVIRPSKNYVYPTKAFDLLNAGFNDFKAAVKSSDKDDLVRALATNLGLGGAYAEELCIKADVDKGISPELVSDDKLRRLYDELQAIINKVKHLELNPRVIIRNNRVHDVVPFELRVYNGLVQKVFMTYNEALDYFYVVSEREAFEFEKQRLMAENQARINAQINFQEDHLNSLLKDSELLRQRASLIKDNLELINNAVNSVLKSRDEGLSWAEIKTNFAGKGVVKDLRLEDKVLVLSLDNLEIDLNSKPSDLMNELFLKAKKVESKIGGAEQTINELREKLSSLSVEDVSFEKNMPKPIAYKTGSWFEGYRWFNTSDGLLVVAGRDATQNEELYVKRLDPDDLVFHADIKGSSLVILKKGRNAGEKSINEAAAFAACHSKAWKAGISIDVYYARPEQFTKSSNFMLDKGSFVVKGKKDYVRGLRPSIALGVELINELNYRLISGPLEAVKYRSKRFIQLTPGDSLVSDVAREVREFFKIQGYSIGIEDIQKAMPSGSLRIDKKF